MITVWMRRAIATHIADLDGVGSSAVLQRAFPEAEVYFLDYNDCYDTFREIVDSGVDEVYLADFNLGDANRDAMELLESADVDLYWYDHHRWNAEMKERTEKIAKELVIDYSKCGTELVYERFLPKDSVAKKIAGFAHSTDFGGRMKGAQKISDVISAESGNVKFLKSLSKNLSKGMFWSDELGEMRKEYRMKKSREIEKAIGNAVFYSARCGVDNLEIAFTRADRCLKGGYVGSKLTETYGNDISIILYPSGSMSLRMAKEHEGKFDLSEWARLFGGGGHANAGGAQYEKEITDENFMEAVDAITKKLPLKDPRRLDKCGS